MSIVLFFALWSAAAIVAAPLIGRLLAGRHRPAAVVHLLTARQAAELLGVSPAAVMAWQRDGLLPTACCAGCGPSSTIEPGSLRPLLDRSIIDLDAELAELAARSPVGAQS